jgi:hypothetical protein
MDLVFSQFHLPPDLKGESAVRESLNRGVPSATSTIAYQSSEDNADFALAQFFPSATDGSLIPGPTPDASQMARYWGRLITDTGECEEQGSVLMIVAFNIPADVLADVEAWYSEEHIPMLFAADGWLRARRFGVVAQQGGTVFNSIALHELRDMSVLDAPERTAARSTPWRAKYASEPWFEQSGRFFYNRIGSDEKG